MQEVIKMLIIIKFTFYLVIVDNAQISVKEQSGFAGGLFRI